MNHSTEECLLCQRLGTEKDKDGLYPCQTWLRLSGINEENLGPQPIDIENPLPEVLGYQDIPEAEKHYICDFCEKFIGDLLHTYRYGQQVLRAGKCPNNKDKYCFVEYLDWIRR